VIGQTVGHYSILEKLGEGGMGVVYKARDSHLNRSVALKVLPPQKVADPERKRRFVREARSASALNHPNIVTVHDIDQSDGVDFIAMEYVAGKTLDHLIGRKGLKLNDALKYAIQIADALAAADAASIVHRDLKPANIMVTEKGLIKVLDFGLAKLTEPAQSDEFGPTVTMTAHTEEGTIVGTVAYMSPEQAEGKPIDARSDIFSFGAVLYEMVTGRRAFQGDTKLSTLASIMHEEPKPVREVVEDIPELLERLILQCLKKQPARRFQHMDDIKVELETLKEDSESGKLSRQAAAPRRWSKAWMLAAGAVATVLLAAGAWYYLRPKPAPPQRTAVRRLTWDNGLTTDPVLSPDGTRVAYASDSGTGGNLDIWIQQVATGDRLRLTHNEADKYEPAFSPDGNRIAYRSEEDGGGIYVVSTLGGEPRRIARGGRRPRFSPNGELIAYWAGGWSQGPRREGSLFVIPPLGPGSRSKSGPTSDGPPNRSGYRMDGTFFCRRPGRRDP
jgi:eukaryotic-like serine/threonine-protein kinase